MCMSQVEAGRYHHPTRAARAGTPARSRFRIRRPTLTEFLLTRLWRSCLNQSEMQRSTKSEPGAVATGGSVQYELPFIFHECQYTLCIASACRELNPVANRSRFRSCRPTLLVFPPSAGTGKTLVKQQENCEAHAQNARRSRRENSSN